MLAYFRDAEAKAVLGVLAVSCGGLRVVNLYVPNGQSVGSEKYQYKLRWLQALHAWLRAELTCRSASAAIAGRRTGWQLFMRMEINNNFVRLHDIFQMIANAFDG